MSKAWSAALLFLAACSGPTNASPPPSPEASAATERKVEERSDLLDFSYSWPAEAAAIAPLAAEFEADLAARRTEALATAREDKAARPADAPFNGHYFSKTWALFGNSPRLLSLAAEISTYTGGAHPLTVSETRLWDRELGRAISAADLFADPAAAFASLSQGYCAALDRQREEKRGEPVQHDDPDDWMTVCPPLAKATIAPVDADENGRFELLRVLIDPYDAGPYAEGSYEVDIPITDAVRALIKPEYAGEFGP